MIPTWLLDRKTWIVIAALTMLGYGAWWLNNYAATQYQAGYDARIAEEAELRNEQDVEDLLILESVLTQQRTELERAQQLIAELQSRKPEVITNVITEYVDSSDGCDDLGPEYLRVWESIHGDNNASGQSD